MDDARMGEAYESLSPQSRAVLKTCIARMHRIWGESPERAIDLYIADTVNELGLFYRLSQVAFLGGSLVEGIGGHNPIEPAKLGCALLHGPHVANFQADYAALGAGGAARAVDAGTLAGTLGAILADPPARRAMGQAARAALDRAAPDPAPLVARLLALAKPA